MKIINIENYVDLLTELRNRIEFLTQSKNSEVRKAAGFFQSLIDKRKEGGNKLIADNNTLRIGIVGQVKAGKSSFLNSLFFEGENVLPKASTPMTAGLTILDYGEKEEFIVEYYNKKEWEDFEERAKIYDEEVEEYKQNTGECDLTDDEVAKKANIDESYIAAKELISKCTHQIKHKIKSESLCEVMPIIGKDNLHQQLEMYIGADGKYTSIVKSLTLRLNDPRLRGVQIVDTPGVNDPVLSREQRTKEFLRNSHGVFFLSYSGRFFDATDVQFLSNRIGSEGICSVVLIGSKFDSALQQVGEKHKNKINNAIYECEQALKSQYKNNMRDAEYYGSEPILTWASAVCYAIASKSPSKWDETEKHTLSRLQHYFPNMFGTSPNLNRDDIDTFREMSNIDIIKEEYLTKTFVANKDKIIKEKVNSYFTSSTSEICDYANKALISLNNKLSVLKSTDINTLAAKKQLYRKVINNIEANISTIVTTVDSQAQQAEKNVLNSVSLTYSGGIPTDCRSQMFTRKSTFWGRNKSFYVDVEVVKVDVLCDRISTHITKTVNMLAYKWSEENKTLTEGIRTKFYNIIQKAEELDSTGNFDAEILRGMVDETLTEMENHSTINFSELRDKYIYDLEGELQGCDRIRWDKTKISESDAVYKINEQVQDNLNNVRGIIKDFMRVFANDCKQYVRKARELAKNTLKDNKDTFINSINNQSEEFLTQLEEQLRNKTEQQDSYEQAIDLFTKILNER